MIETQQPSIALTRERRYFYYDGAEKNQETCSFPGPCSRRNAYIFLNSDKAALELFYQAYDVCEWLHTVFGLPLDA